MGSACCRCDGVDSDSDRAPLERGGRGASRDHIGPPEINVAALSARDSRRPTTPLIRPQMPGLHHRVRGDREDRAGQRAHSLPHVTLFRPGFTPQSATTVEQVRKDRVQGIINQIPVGSYTEGKHNTDCPICIVEFEIGDVIRYLPCRHVFHKACIDDWLARKLRCPSCMEAVDVGLFKSFEDFSSI